MRRSGLRCLGRGEEWTLDVGFLGYFCDFLGIFLGFSCDFLGIFLFFFEDLGLYELWVF